MKTWLWPVALAVWGLAIAATPADKFAKEIVKAMLTKPGDFIVNGLTVATVSADGRCSLTGSTLSPADAVALNAWLTSNYGGSP